MRWTTLFTLPSINMNTSKPRKGWKLNLSTTQIFYSFLFYLAHFHMCYFTVIPILWNRCSLSFPFTDKEWRATEKVTLTTRSLTHRTRSWMHIVRIQLYSYFPTVTTPRPVLRKKSLLPTLHFNHGLTTTCETSVVIDNLIYQGRKRHSL